MKAGEIFRTEDELGARVTGSPMERLLGRLVREGQHVNPQLHECRRETGSTPSGPDDC